MKKINYRLHLPFTLLFSLTLAVPSFAQEKKNLTVNNQTNSVKLGFNAGPEAYFGYTQYRIGGTFVNPDGVRYKIWFPLSELKFPMNITMFSSDMNIEIFRKFFIHGNFKKNITSDAGKMEDSDWGVNHNNPDSLDIFSKSDAELNAWILNSDFMVKVVNVSFFSLNTGAGYMYQSFDYDISNLDQWYPSTPQYGHDYVMGSVLTYTVKYYIPYIVVAPCLNFKEKLKISQSIAFSPYVIAKDIDNHILRFKESSGDSRGVAFITSFKIDYFFTPVFYFGLNMDYTYILTEGTQKQIQYADTWDAVNGFRAAGPIGEIDNRISSSQFSIGIRGGIKF